MGAQQAKDTASGSGKRKPGDKKKTSQSSKKDGRHQSDSDSLASTSNNQWLSEENMADGVAGEDNENLFVALYDFQSGGENQLDLVKGEKVIVLEHNKDNEWSRVEKKNNSVSTSGWIPTNYIASASSNSKFSWFHGPLSRNAAEYLLSSGITGSFLVRESESCPGQMTISLRFEEKYFHYKIQGDFDMVYVAEEQRFTSLDELVKFYSKEPGLVTLLQFPVRRVNKPPIFALSPEMEKWEVERSEIEMKQQLGSGQYGDVYEAVWKRHNRQVAVKTLRGESTALQEFMKEVTIMKEMKHQNLVQLLGICTWQPPYYIITEFMSQGNLLDYLRNSSPEELGPVILFYMATQIASAMGYLEKKNFIHRDLAARNCLVGEHHLVKVADFGLARLMLDDIYTAQTTCKFPIKWTAPEGLMYGSFSTKSDVWAFGVLLWELATYGETPYPSLELQHVYQFLERGNRMSCPPGCPSNVYDLMLKCWNWEPAERPTFHEIHEILQKSDTVEVEKKLGGSETNPDLVKTDAVLVSGNNDRESVSVTPPLSHVPKPSDFIPVKQAAETGSRKPPMPPRKDVAQDHQLVKQDGKDSRSSKPEIVKNRIIGHQYSLDESRSDCQKTLIDKAKSLPPKPTVNPAVLGAVVAALRKTADRDALTPSLNDQRLSEMPSSFKQLSNPPAVEACQTDKPGDASGAKHRTVPNGRSGTDIGSLEITSHRKFMPKKKAHSASESFEAESNSEDSWSAQLTQPTKPVALNFAENKSDSSRTLSKKNAGDASVSGSSSGPQKPLKSEGSVPPATKPKPPAIGPKPTGAKQHQQTIVTPF